MRDGASSEEQKLRKKKNSNQYSSGAGCGYRTIIDFDRIRYRTSWFKHKPRNFISHECRMRWQFEIHIFGIMLTAINSGRGDIASFFVRDLGLALSPKMCPDQSQAFKEVNNSQAFTVGGKKNELFFSERAASRCSKAHFPKVSRKKSKN